MESVCCQENEVPVEFDHHRYIHISGKKNQENLPQCKFCKLSCCRSQMRLFVSAHSGPCCQSARNFLFRWHCCAESELTDVDSVDATRCVQVYFGLNPHPSSKTPSGLSEERWTEDVLRSALTLLVVAEPRRWSPTSQSTMLKPLCCLQGLFLNEGWIRAWLHLFPWLQSKISWGCCLLNDRGAHCSVIIALLTAWEQIFL